jgi:copper chaperone CopZ
MTTPMQKSYSIQGMSCDHCEMSVREEVEELPGVSSARANHTTGSLVVTGELIDDAAVQAAVAAAGYEVVSAPQGESSGRHV